MQTDQLLHVQWQQLPHEHPTKHIDSKKNPKSPAFFIATDLAFALLDENEFGLLTAPALTKDQLINIIKPKAFLPLATLKKCKRKSTKSPAIPKRGNVVPSLILWPPNAMCIFLYYPMLWVGTKNASTYMHCTTCSMLHYIQVLMFIDGSA